MIFPDIARTAVFTMRKNTRIFAISLALVMYGSAAQAYESTAQVIKRQAPPGISNAFYGCVEKAESDDIALAACQSAEKERQDARLSAAYQSLLSKQHGTAKEDLNSANRAWLDFHSTSNAFEASLYGSEGVSSFQVMQRQLFRLCERANVLEEYLSIANDQ